MPNVYGIMGHWYMGHTYIWITGIKGPDNRNRKPSAGHQIIRERCVKSKGFSDGESVGGLGPAARGPDQRTQSSYLG